MPSLKRRLADIFERAFSVKIVQRTTLEPLGLMDLFESAHLRRVLNELQIDCVFDVGANNGQYLKRLRKIGFNGPIISFEPIPELAANLIDLAKTDRRLFVEQVALDAAEGERKLNIMASNDFSSLHAPLDSPLARQNSVVRTVNVSAHTLDSAFYKWQSRLSFKRPFLKMDTQGNDLAIAKGGRTVLKQFLGIQTELSIRKLYGDTPSYREALEYYSEQGFDISAIVPNVHAFPHLFEMDAILIKLSADCIGDGRH